MRLFTQKQVRQAMEFAAEGGQSLHVHRLGVGPTSPAAFREAVARGEHIAHLFDQDAARLVGTARRLGVDRPAVQDRGTRRQHVDLCGLPLHRAELECTPPPAPDGPRGPTVYDAHPELLAAPPPPPPAEWVVWRRPQRGRGRRWEEFRRVASYGAGVGAMGDGNWDWCVLLAGVVPASKRGG